MDQRKLANWLKFIIIGMGICGIIVYACVLPAAGTSIIRVYPELTSWYGPWLCFLWITVIPCYGVLICCWRVAVNIQKGRAFSYENGKSFQWIFRLAAGDCMFFLGGNIVLWLFNMNHPGVLVVSMVVLFFGISIAIASKALSQLIDNAAVMEEEQALTI